MLETLKVLDVTMERKEGQKEVKMPVAPSVGKSFAEVVKEHKRNGRSVARVEVSHKDLCRDLKRLDQCIVGSWDPKSMKGEDLRSWGNQMARFWGLKGNLRLAKLERGKVLLEFEMIAEAEKTLNMGGILVGKTFLRLEKWNPRAGCLLEGEEKNEAWVRIVGLPISLWDRDTLRKVREKCGGLLAIDTQTERLEELQWARILVKLSGEEIPSMIEIGVKGVCYLLVLWWELRPVMRVLPAERRGKNSGVEGEVEGDVSTCAGKRVMEVVDGARLETHLQFADGTREQTGGSGSLWARSRGPIGSLLGDLEGLHRALGVGSDGLDSSPKTGPHPIGPSSSVGPSSLEGLRPVESTRTCGLTGRKDYRDPAQSLVGYSGVALPLVWAGPSHLREPYAEGFPFWDYDGRQRQAEVELFLAEKSRTDCALIEEASRYGCAPIPCGLMATGSSPSLFIFGWTHLGEFCDLSGNDRVTHLRETPLRMLLTLGSPEEENASR